MRSLIPALLLFAFALFAYPQQQHTSAVYAIRKVADQSITSSTTLTNDTELFAPVEANKNYHFRASVPFNLAGVVSGYKFTFASPSGHTNFVCTPLIYNGGTSTLLTVAPITTPGTAVAGALATSGDHYAAWEGVLENGASAGNINFQFAQNTSNGSAITVKRGAILIVMQVK